MSKWQTKSLLSNEEENQANELAGIEDYSESNNDKNAENTKKRSLSPNDSSEYDAKRPKLVDEPSQKEIPENEPEPTESEEIPENEPEPTESEEIPENEPEPTESEEIPENEPKPTESEEIPENEPEPTESQELPIPQTSAFLKDVNKLIKKLKRSDLEYFHAEVMYETESLKHSTAELRMFKEKQDEDLAIAQEELNEKKTQYENLHMQYKKLLDEIQNQKDTGADEPLLITSTVGP